MGQKVNPIGLRLQVLESDHLDTARNGVVNGAPTIQGIALGNSGEPIGYWLLALAAGGGLWGAALAVTGALSFMGRLGAVVASGAPLRKAAKRSGWVVAAAVGRETEPPRPRPRPEMSAPASSIVVCAAQ